METKIWAPSQTFYITFNKGHPHPSQGCTCNYLLFFKMALNQSQEILFIVYLINTQQKKQQTRKGSSGVLP